MADCSRALRAERPRHLQTAEPLTVASWLRRNTNPNFADSRPSLRSPVRVAERSAFDLSYFLNRERSRSATSSTWALR